MKPYELRRAIRQIAIIQGNRHEPPPPARYFGGLLRYAADQILGLIRHPEDVQIITVRGHDVAWPYQLTILEKSDARMIHGGEMELPPPHVIEVSRFAIEPKRLAVRAGGGPILVIYGGYVDKLRSFYLFAPAFRVSSDCRIARKPNT